MNLYIWWLTIRPKTLLASIGPILLGSAIATKYQPLNSTVFILALLCSCALQISVNLANDLFDGLSGVDSKERLGPQRALQSGWLTAAQIKYALVFFTLLAIASGIYLLLIGGWPIVLCGVFSIIGIYAYSAGPYPLASYALGELTVLIFFGWIAVIGSYYLQQAPINAYIIIMATIAGLYSSAIMLVNNIRDIPTDSKANKNTLAVILGRPIAEKLYILMLIFAQLLTIIAYLFSNHIEALAAAVFCFLPTISLTKKIHQTQGKAYNQLLAQTAVLGFIFCLSTALVILLHNT